MSETLGKPVLTAQNINIYYGKNKAVNDVNFKIKDRNVCAFIGPSGCGKSTLLRSFNRMNDFIGSFRLEGKVLFKGQDIYSPEVDPVLVRKKIGMVFQKPNPFPSSIVQNITWGPRLNGFEGNFDELVETSLRSAALWDEVKDRLSESGLSLSGGQQQRLCIARTIAMSPEVILMDEPCASLDPISTTKIERLIAELKKKFCILVVTHSMQQALRISDQTLFMYRGDLIEHGDTKQIFTNPQQSLTEDYVMGKFG